MLRKVLEDFNIVGVGRAIDRWLVLMKLINPMLDQETLINKQLMRCDECVCRTISLRRKDEPISV